MNRVPRRAPEVLLCTVSSDSHTWNLVYIDLLLREHDFHVVNLGPCTPADLVLTSARTRRPAAIVVSSVNGHGQVDGVALAQVLRADDALRTVPLIIGGKLGISGSRGRQLDRELLAAGFDVVFDDATDSLELVATLRELVAGPQRVGSAR